MRQTALQKRLHYFWDLIDISENIKRAERVATSHSNGISAAMNLIAMFVLTLVSAALAWKFDFESTLIGMTTLKDVVMTGLPSTVVKFSTWLIVAITIAPTMIELFTAAYAKADIKIVQVYVMAFTAFDLITDIPRAKAFTDQLQPNFTALGPIIDWIGYWVFFFFWLFLSTIGFELGMVIFGFLTLCYGIKMLAGEGNTSKSGYADRIRSEKATVIDGNSGEKVKVVA